MVLKRMLTLAVAVAATLVAGVAQADWQLNLPKGVTPVSHDVYDLHMLAFWVCVGIGVLVFGAMIWSLIYHRRSRGAEAAQFHESTAVEIVWTVVPFIILVALAIPAADVLLKMENTSNSDLTIKATGYQWLWHYDYIGKGVSFYSRLDAKSNAARQKDSGIDPATVPHYLRNVDHPMVVPVHKKVRMLLTSGDVIHAWWVPDLGEKKDAIPGYINEIWFKVDKPGTYRGQCAELCGRGHAFMPIVVKAVSEGKFQTWLKQHGGHTGTAAGQDNGNQGAQAAAAGGNAGSGSDANAGQQAGNGGGGKQPSGNNAGQQAGGGGGQKANGNGGGEQANGNGSSGNGGQQSNDNGGRKAGDSSSGAQTDNANGANASSDDDSNEGLGTEEADGSAGEQSDGNGDEQSATGGGANTSSGADVAKISKDDLMAAGKKVFNSNCAACHQKDGSGNSAAGFPTLAGSSIVTGPIAVHIQRVLHGKNAMPPFGTSLSDKQIAAVVTYERNSFGNKTGDVVQPAQVKAQR